jgi:hypothetical protein
VLSLVSAFFGWGLLFVSKMGFCQRASYDRACELATQAGFIEEVEDDLREFYGMRPTNQ